MRMLRFAVMVVAAALLMGVDSTSAQAKEWKIDSAHSEADFAIKHLAVSIVRGSFHGVTGVVIFDQTDISKSSVEASIDAASVDTGLSARDAHLKSPDFFDVSKFSTVRFRSTMVARAGDHYDVTGNLTLHGVTRSVMLVLETPSTEQADGSGELHRRFTATTIINRKDFGLVWNGAVKSGDAVLADDVKIELNIEAIPGVELGH